MEHGRQRIQGPRGWAGSDQGCKYQWRTLKFSAYLEIVKRYDYERYDYELVRDSSVPKLAVQPARRLKSSINYDELLSGSTGCTAGLRDAPS